MAMASRFKKVLRSAKPFRSEINRDPPGALVFPSGLAKFNTGGTGYFLGLAAAVGIDPEEYSVVLGGDEAKKEAAAWVVKPRTEGASPVRRDPTKKTITLYLHEVFKDMPSLRPGSRRWCQVSTEDDPEEGTCVVISLSIALDPKVRKKRQTGPGPEPAPGPSPT